MRDRERPGPSENQAIILANRIKGRAKYTRGMSFESRAERVFLPPSRVASFVKPIP